MENLRTACFVDGYNLFYGLLSGTTHKWLDLRSLLSHILYVENPQYVLHSVSFFTSSVKPRLATRGIQSKEAQDTYRRALEAKGVKVFTAHHQLQPGAAPRFVEGTDPSRTDLVKIWKLEEKLTDVHISVSMYRLAARQLSYPLEEQVQQIVLVSADTDMTPALEAIREDFPDLRIGLILPHREGSNRAVPGSLKNQAHWTRHVIKNEELSDHQFPPRVGTAKKPAIKPDYW